ncbi:hypothetical protein R1sor_017223 [Riccia sorocarpa]|uniref:Flavin-containing monooxygenase n=1 Tax=Riccia sorocarpa TaxID=122646 RepID=A0ABD3I6M0_9MARC
MGPEAQATTTDKSSSRVLVIGAGAAGLVAALELCREGLEVVVYEQLKEVGGVWIYSPEIESDPLGLDPRRNRVHSSMYQHLRTNLPREIMGYLDFPFLPLPKQGRDERRFPRHEEVNLYLRDFAEHNDILGLIELGVEVEYVGVLGGKDIALSDDRNLKWLVRSRKVGEVDQVREEVFDAVVICNGHYAEPKVVSIPGIERWPGFHMHSHNYRVPDPFKDKVVVIIGNANSGGDISKEVATVAKEVHISARTWPVEQQSVSEGGPRKNIWHHPLVERAYESGTVKFEDGKTAKAESIIQCTGYFYSFPFLDAQGLISVEDGRVAPLYKHLFVPSLGPSLSFVGLPSKVVPFPLFQAQMKWIAKLLSGKLTLPPPTVMMAEVEKFYQDIEAKGIPRYQTLKIGIHSYEYVDWLLEQCGEEPAESWRKEIYLTTGVNRRLRPDYRDCWQDQELLEIATASLRELAKKLGIEVGQTSEKC